MIIDDIAKEILLSLKAGKTTDVKVLRCLLSLIKYAQIDKKEPLTDRETELLLRKEIKKRNEAIQMFKKGKRDDLVNDEEEQLEIIARYLPPTMNMDNLEKAVEKILNTIPDKTNIGRATGMVIHELNGKAEGSLIAEIVRAKLSNNHK